MSAANDPEGNDIPGGIDADDTPPAAALEPEAAGELEEESHPSGADPTEPIAVDEAGVLPGMAPDGSETAAHHEDIVHQGDRTPDPNVRELAPDELVHRNEYGGAYGEMQAQAEESHDAPSPDVAEPAVGQSDQDTVATACEVASSTDGPAGEALVKPPRRRSFGRRSTALPQPGTEHEPSPSAPDGDAHSSVAEESATTPAEADIHDPRPEGSARKLADSESLRLLDDADRAADPEPHLPTRLADPKTEEELANAAKLLGISFREDPKRPRAELQLEDDDETVKAARRLGIRFRDEPESADTPDLDDAMTRAALELGISFRDAGRSGPVEKSPLRRYWPIILLLALAAVAMPVVAAMLMFMGDS